MTSKTVVQLSPSITFVVLIAIIGMIFAMPSSLHQLDLSAVTLNNNSWAEILENWITSQSNNATSRTARISNENKTPTNKREVTVADLYLLDAIEKLLYRVKNLEKRLKRAEELLYYVIAGSNKKKEPCPANYIRMGKNCYHFSDREFDWKSSASLCRGLGGHLVELDSIEEGQDVIAGLMSDPNLKGINFWMGGLDLELVWIWFSSGRPIRETKQPVLGNGRCLKLTFNQSSKIYSYKGEDCTSRQRYICESNVEDESANEIERTARLLIDKDN